MNFVLSKWDLSFAIFAIFQLSFFLQLVKATKQHQMGEGRGGEKVLQRTRWMRVWPQKQGIDEAAAMA